MLILAHLGIGKALVSPVTQKLSSKWIYLGAILPDLIDKPLYYGLCFMTGKHGLELGFISGTRTLGHTALFTMLIAFLAYWKRSKALAALSLGLASHLVLDSAADHLWDTSFRSDVSLFWPLKGTQMPVADYSNIFEHLKNKSNPGFLWAELVGAALLIRDYFSKPLHFMKARSGRAIASKLTK